MCFQKQIAMPDKPGMAICLSIKKPICNVILSSEKRGRNDAGGKILSPPRSMVSSFRSNDYLRSLSMNSRLIVDKAANTRTNRNSIIQLSTILSSVRS